MEKLIKIHDNIIDADKIFCIYPIKGAAEFINYLGRKFYTEYSFDIYLYGNKTITIKLNGYEYFHPEFMSMNSNYDYKIEYWVQKADSDKQSAMLKEKLEKAQQQLIDFWNQTKSVIPEIKIV